MTSAPGIGVPGGAPWYRVTAIPDVGYGGTADRDYAAVLPAVLDAAARGRPFVTGWLSRGGGAPLELITNSGPLPAGQGQPDQPDQPDRPPAEAGPRRELLFPWGARGVLARPGLAADLAGLTWAPCPGRQAPPAGGHGGQGWAGNGSGPAVAQGGRSWLPAGSGLTAPTLFESALTTLMTRPFGWLVVADPVSDIDAQIAALRGQLNVLRRYDEEGARFDADRAASRLAELDAYREAGLWDIRVLVGAADAVQLAVIAPMLVGAADLNAHPYRLRGPDQPPASLAEALAAASPYPGIGSDGSGPAGDPGLAAPARGTVPFSATAGLLAALAGLPRREVPGVRLLDVGYFDVTAEPAPGAEVSVGTILDGQDRPVGDLAVPLATINRHALITGATGSGKSQTVRHLLGQLTRAGIPWLVVEPVKSEYGAMAGRIAADGAKLTLINPADPAAVPLAVNPLAPEPGYPVQAHIDMVRALFLAAFDAHEPFPQIMSQALQRVYESCGWDPVSGEGRPGAVVPPAVPTLAQLQNAALDVIEDVGYGPELQADVRGFVDVRLRSLRTGSAGRFFEGGHPADIAELLRRDAVLAIEDVANDEDKAFLIGTLIIRITEHLRLRARAADRGEHHERELRHVIVIEEAHRLLRAGREGAGAHAVELFASMLAEIRAYGEGLLIAEQIPAKLVPDVVKNTALKIVHRLPAHDDRELVGATMNLDAEQSRQVVSFPPGVAAVFADGMDRPVRIQVPFGGPAERAADPAELAEPPIAARRSAACGPSCTGQRACSLLELRTADLEARSSRSAWLRVWTEAVVLAFLTNSPLPVVPAALRAHWAGLDPRLRECVLATVTERAVAARSQAIREHFAPERLTAAVSQAALRMLGGGKGAGTSPGPDWVIPQLQWLHEIERALPLTGPTVDPFELALPLEFELAGLSDRPDIKIGQRVSALRRHALSMELDSNRLPAWTALLGEDDQRAFCADLAVLAVGASHRGQLLQAAGEMGVAGWLEPVLSWPRRFIVGYDSGAGTATAADVAGRADAAVAADAAEPAMAAGRD
ncbi:MAG TPA: ATP-binding protein [Streptosporangiaceae bacterium]